MPKRCIGFPSQSNARKTVVLLNESQRALFSIGIVFARE